MSNILKTIRKGTSAALRKTADVVDPPDREITEADRERNKRIDAMRDAGRAQADPFVPMDADGRRYLFGDQTEGLKVKEGWLPVADNQLAPMVDQSQAMLSLRRPTIRATALQPNDTGEKQAAELSGQAINWQFHKGIQLPLRLIEAQPDLFSFGWCLLATYWEPKAEWDQEHRRWDGKIMSELIDPACYYADGLASRKEACQYEFTLTRMPVEKAKERWPEFAADILKAARKEHEREKNSGDNRYDVRQQPGSTSAETLSATRRSDLGDFGTNGRLLKALDGVQNVRYGTADSQDDHPAYVTVLEMIFADYTEREFPYKVEEESDVLFADGRLTVNEQGVEVNPETNEVYPNGEWPTRDLSYIGPLYPNGRHIIRFGDDLVVVDEPWRYKHSLWKIGRLGVLPRTWRGKNAVEGAKPTQDEWNILRMHETNWVRNHADSGYQIRLGTFPDDPTNQHMGQTMKNRPGHCVSIAKDAAPDAIKTREVPPLPAGLKEILDRRDQQFKNIMGMHDTRMGNITGQTLGEIQLAENNDRIRGGLSGLLLDMFTLDVMAQVWELCVTHWSPGDWVRVLGEEATTSIQITPEMLNAEFELSMEVTTQLPYDRERKKADAAVVFDKMASIGMADLALKWLLKVFEAPEAEEILEVVAQRQAQAEADAKKAESEAVQEAAAGEAEGESKRKPAKAGVA